MKVHEIEGPKTAGGRTLVVVLAKGEEAVKALKQVATTQRLGTSRITAVGGFARATLGYFDRDQRKYLPIQISEQAEVLSLVGDVADDEQGSPSVHLHAVLGLRDGRTRGGHLLAAEVWPTLEVVIGESPAHLRNGSTPRSGWRFLSRAEMVPPQRAVRGLQDRRGHAYRNYLGPGWVEAPMEKLTDVFGARR